MHTPLVRSLPGGSERIRPGVVSYGGVGSSENSPLRKFPTESLILAQDERWRCASNMQVERGLAAPQGAVQL